MLQYHHPEQETKVTGIRELVLITVTMILRIKDNTVCKKIVKKNGWGKDKKLVSNDGK